MLEIIKKILKMPFIWREYLSVDQQSSALFRYFGALPKKQGTPENVVLVQCVEAPYYYGLFGQIINSLREQHCISVELYVLRSVNVGETQSILHFIHGRFISNRLCNYKWVRLYRQFSDRVAYRNAAFSPVKDVIAFFSAWCCWRNLTDKQSLLCLEIDGVAVGDLINDTFIRFKPSPTVDIKDIFLLVLIWQAFCDVRQSKKYFSKVKPTLYLTSYGVYTHHGIPARVALQNGVQVISFGNYQEFAKRLSLEDWYQTRNPDLYAETFLKMNDQEEKLAVAEAALSARMAGAIDGATLYMKKSAYMESEETVPDIEGAAVIFLHDFYDSPHIYRSLVFPDFWEWICFTIEVLKASKIPFYLKPHPNQITLSSDVLDVLKARYPGLAMISPSISNKKLAEAGMSFAITVFGTIAHEMAYLGVPSVCCSHHPHINFDFCRTAHNRDEYAALLKSSTSFKMDKDVMRRQSLIFYYMHNLAYPPESLELMEAYANYRRSCENPDGDKDLVVNLHNMSLCTGFKSQVSKFIQ